MVKVVILKADGKTPPYQTIISTDELKDWYKALNVKMIEMLYLRDDLMVVCDENGLYNAKLNEWYESLKPPTHVSLYGDIALVKLDKETGDFIDTPLDIVDEIPTLTRP